MTLAPSVGRPFAESGRFVDPLFATLGDVFTRAQVAERAVRTDDVVVLPLLPDPLQRIGERTELLHVQAFVRSLSLKLSM